MDNNEDKSDYFAYFLHMRGVQIHIPNAYSWFCIDQVSRHQVFIQDFCQGGGAKATIAKLGGGGEDSSSNLAVLWTRLWKHVPRELFVDLHVGV